MADTTITCTVSPCTVVIHYDLPLLNLSADDAMAISVAIAGVWVVAWAIRMVIRSLNAGPGEPVTDD